MAQPGLEIRVLGPLRASRDGAPLELTRSRKMRALLGFLALTAEPVARSRLCDLLWDVPNDPRGELRWCLSKIRRLFDTKDRPCVIPSAPDHIEFDRTDCWIDARELGELARAGFANAPDDALSRVCSSTGTLLEGLELDGPPAFTTWLSAQRHRYRGLQIAAMEELTKRAPSDSDQLFSRVETWLSLAPFDARAHEALLGALIQRARLREADEHLAQAIRAFEREGVDWSPLREAVRSARATTVTQVSVAAVAEPSTIVLPQRRRASVAVIPFVDPTTGPGECRVGDYLTEDVITGLAKLRAMFVIARGTVYALRDRNIDPHEAGRILNVEYVVSGVVRRAHHRLSVVIEVAETREARIVWTDELECATDDTFSVVRESINRIVAAVASGIEAAECERAVLRAPSSLDAWEAYHRGLWHMYKFNGPDNHHAEGFFRTSLELDPTFARAYAGLSFTHFQNVFLGLTADRAQQIQLAFETANQSVSTDDRDPAAHWAMGRALWLRGAQDESLAELRRSVDLSPNFALGHYTLGFVQSQSGDPKAAIDACDFSRELSPFDPLQFGMLASRAVAHVRLEQFAEAAEWAIRAVARPNAHAHILAIASECLALADRRDEARAFVARIRSRLPAYSVEDFLRAFRFKPDTEKLFRASAREIGFD